MQTGSVQHALTEAQWGDPGRLPALFSEARRAPSLVVIEGFHALKHAIRFGAELMCVVAVEPAALEALASKLAPDLLGRFTQVAEPIPVEVFRQLSKNLPQTQVMAIARRRTCSAEDLVGDPSLGPVIYLEDPRNLGNVGAVVRVAAAAGAVGVITSGMSDPWDSAAIRGSAGLHFAVPVCRRNQEVDVIPEGRPIVAVDPQGAPLNAQAIPDRPLLAFGTERYGLSDQMLRRADFKVRIPMRAGVSSLNLATSVAVLLYSRSWGQQMPL
ncbi:TrmH family RNA methyltransferase [Micromonospora sp. CPCC 205558]|uniref:TrmH family RNA methyltransferase n=1 Tax=Micromonospora sp. CPCC 205558 TaxID=3122403 RepID=UPI002FF0C41E